MKIRILQREKIVLLEAELTFYKAMSEETAKIIKRQKRQIAALRGIVKKYINRKYVCPHWSHGKACSWIYSTGGECVDEPCKSVRWTKK
jgi:hypothetical protein